MPIGCDTNTIDELSLRIALGRIANRRKAGRTRPTKPGS
jgi:hypothetical protein